MNVSGATALVPPGAAPSPAGLNPGVAAAPPVLPAPEADPSAQLYELLATTNEARTRTAERDASLRARDRQAALDAQARALDAARAAEKSKKGFFDSIGVAGLAGLAAGSPILVMADMTMHMARATPDALRSFEEKNADTIATAGKLYAGVGGSPASFGAARALTCAAALGAIAVEKSAVLGKEGSDHAATALVVAVGMDGAGAARAAVGVAADKGSATADRLRKVEAVTQPYTKWAAIAGMSVAAAGTLVASGGTAAPVLVAIGLALSTAGFATSETRCLDGAVGHGAATWISAGMEASGAVVSGAGALAGAGAAACSATDAMSAGGDALAGAADWRTGTERVRDAAVAHVVDERDADAHDAGDRAARALVLLDDIVQAVRGMEDDLARGRAITSSIVETQARTQLAAASVKG